MTMTMTNSHDDDDDCVFCSGGSGQRLQVQHIQEAYRRMRCEGKHAHTLSTLHKPHTTHCIITHHTSHITQHTHQITHNTHCRNAIHHVRWPHVITSHLLNTTPIPTSHQQARSPASAKKPRYRVP